jgi:hypothetical protein
MEKSHEELYNLCSFSVNCNMPVKMGNLYKILVRKTGRENTV